VFRNEHRSAIKAPRKAARIAAGAGSAKPRAVRGELWNPHPVAEPDSGCGTRFGL